MEKILIVSLALFLGTGAALFADCARQSADSVSFTVTINPTAGDIHRIVLTFQVSTGDPTSLVVSTPFASPDIDGSLTDTDTGDPNAPWELWTNTINKTIGYRAIYEPELNTFYFGKNPETDLAPSPSGGLFSVSDLNTFTLQISGLAETAGSTDPYTITGVTVAAEDLSYNDVADGATLESVAPCNQAPNIGDIYVQYSSTVPRYVTLTAVPPIDQELDEDAEGDLVAAWSSADTSIPGTTVSVSKDYSTPPSDDPDSVSVTLTDTDGASTAFGPVPVNPNDRPVVDDIVPTCDPGVPLRVGFTAEISDDDGAVDIPVTFNWNFGDPSTGANNISNLANPTHDFSEDGDFIVTLTVTDARGLPSLEYQEVVNPDDSPTPNIVPPPSGLRIKDALHVGEAPLVVELTPACSGDTSSVPAEL
jgi:hypothetical protein